MNFGSGTFWGIVIVVLIILIIIAYAIYILVNQYYIKIPPNKAAIIYGRTIKIKDEKTKEIRIRGFRIVKGGATLIYPVLEAVEYLDLSNTKVELEVTSILSKNAVKVDVNAIAIVRIGSDMTSLETAAEQFGNMDKEAAREKVQDILNRTLEGHFRTIISTMTPEELYQERGKFSQQVQISAGNPLEAMGMKVVDFTITRVSDGAGYLEALGVAPTADEKMRAAIARSDSERQQKEKESADKVKVREATERKNVQDELSRGREEIEQIQVLERSKIAKIESEIAKVKSEIEHMHKLIELQEKKDELGLIEEKYIQKRKVFKAAGDEQASRREARKIENIAKAEAEAIRLKAEAEADGKRMVAQAYQQLDPTAKMLLIVEQLPTILKAALGEEGLAKVFGEIAEPLGNIDSVKIYDFGGGGGGGGGMGGGSGPINKFANTAPQMLMGMVSKLNDMGFGDFLQNIGLNSDALENLKTGLETTTQANKAAKGSPKKEEKPLQEGLSVKPVTKKPKEKEVEAEYEEIRPGDTIDFDISPILETK